MPHAALVAILVNPKNPNTTSQLKDTEDAARSRNLSILVLYAASEDDIDASFGTLKEKHADALIVGADPFFQRNRDQLLALTARLSLPTIYFQREFAAAGGLISYGIHFPEAYRQAGNYTGRILKGEKPEDLPVVQMTRLDTHHQLEDCKDARASYPTDFARAYRRGHRITALLAAMQFVCVWHIASFRCYAAIWSLAD